MEGTKAPKEDEGKSGPEARQGQDKLPPSTKSEHKWKSSAESKKNASMKTQSHSAMRENNEKQATSSMPVSSPQQNLDDLNLYENENSEKDELVYPNNTEPPGTHASKMKSKPHPASKESREKQPLSSSPDSSRKLKPDDQNFYENSQKDEYVYPDNAGPTQASPGDDTYKAVNASYLSRPVYNPEGERKQRDAEGDRSIQQTRSVGGTSDLKSPREEENKQQPRSPANTQQTQHDETGDSVSYLLRPVFSQQELHGLNVQQVEEPPSSNTIPQGSKEKTSPPSKQCSPPRSISILDSPKATHSPAVSTMNQSLLSTTVKSLKPRISTEIPALPTTTKSQDASAQRGWEQGPNKGARESSPRPSLLPMQTSLQGFNKDDFIPQAPPTLSKPQRRFCFKICLQSISLQDYQQPAKLESQVKVLQRGHQIFVKEWKSLIQNRRFPTASLPKRPLIQERSL
jgi:hypothetical protein